MNEPTPKPEALTVKRKPQTSAVTPTLTTNRGLNPTVRSVYESLALRDPVGAERYLEAHQSR